jgi:hypothetical protein
VLTRNSRESYEVDEDLSIDEATRGAIKGGANCRGRSPKRLGHAPILQAHVT